jgi:adenosylhomocysteinase
MHNLQDMFHRILEQNQAHQCMRFIVVVQMVVDNFQGARFARSNTERPDLARRDNNCEKGVVGQTGMPDAPAGTSVFAWKGETLAQYWDCTFKALTWPDGSGTHQIVDDGGDATLLLQKSFEFEEAGAVLDPSLSDSAEFAEVLRVLRTQFSSNSHHWHNVAAACQGVSEETTTGVHRLYQLEHDGKLLFPAVTVSCDEIIGA